jgi:hypothetical protein
VLRSALCTTGALVLNWDNCAIVMKLDDIGDTVDIKASAGDWEGTSDADGTPPGESLLRHPAVEGTAFDGVSVLGAHLLDVEQVRLPWTEGTPLDGRQRDGHAENSRL